MTVEDEARALIASLREPDGAEAVLANARAIAPFVRANGGPSDEARGAQPPITDILRASGLLRMTFPRRLGGLEMRTAQQAKAAAIVARADAGIGWNVAILNMTGLYATRLPEAGRLELYPIEDLPTSGAFHPPGRAVRTEGGYLVTGDWGYGSGSPMADHVVGGALEFDADGEPIRHPDGRQVILGIVLPPAAIEWKDDWNVVGLRSSGSGGFRITEPAFVPASHVFARNFPDTAGNDPLNRHSEVGFFGLMGVPVGVAARLYDESLAVVRAKRAAGATIDPFVQVQLVEMADILDGVTHQVFGTLERADRVLFEAGGLLTPMQMARAFATQARAGEAVLRLIKIAGEICGATRALMDDSPLQKVIRDALAITAHGSIRSGTRMGLLEPLLAGEGAASAFDDDEEIAGP